MPVLFGPDYLWRRYLVKPRPQGRSLRGGRSGHSEARSP